MGFKIVLIILCVIVIFLVGVVAIDSNRFVMREYTVFSPKADKDYRIVFLSDLHNKRYGKNNKRLAKAVKSADADLILAGGDMITGSKFSGFKNAVSFLKQVSGCAQFYYSFGNHESRLKENEKNRYGDKFVRYNKALCDAGIIIRDNDYYDFGNLRVYGFKTPEKYFSKFRPDIMSHSEIEDVYGKPSKDRLNILLAHDPLHFESYEKWGADLTLSGHLHGGVVRIPGHRGIVSPRLEFFPEYDGGVFEKGNGKMIVSRGLGMHTIPFRMFNPAEIVVINIKKS